jgi:hypothetical protein
MAIIFAVRPGIDIGMGRRIAVRQYHANDQIKEGGNEPHLVLLAFFWSLQKTGAARS